MRILPKKRIEDCQTSEMVYGEEWNECLVECQSALEKAIEKACDEDSIQLIIRNRSLEVSNINEIGECELVPIQILTKSIEKHIRKCFKVEI